MTAVDIVQSALALTDAYQDEPQHTDLKLFLWDLIETFDATLLEDGSHVSDEPRARFTKHWNSATIPWR